MDNVKWFLVWTFKFIWRFIATPFILAWNVIVIVFRFLGRLLGGSGGGSGGIMKGMLADLKNIEVHYK